jgi:restriction system protein
MEEWLARQFAPGSRSDVEFPSNEVRDAYLTSVGRRTNAEIFRLLRQFLVPSGSMGVDNLHLASLVASRESAPEVFQGMLELEYTKRLLLHVKDRNKPPPWEGITWVLDLLPHFPKEAIVALQAYVLAHAQQLPDARYRGLLEATSVIRAKYIGSPDTEAEKLQLLRDMPTRDFEHLVGQLYETMGYDVLVTPAGKDGGLDIVAAHREPGRQEHLLVECKRYKGSVGVEIIRSLLGVVSDKKVNKGVAVTTGKFTRGACLLVEQNPRIELISGESLIRLLNEHLGPTWPSRLDAIIIRSKRKHDN